MDGRTQLFVQEVDGTFSFVEEFAQTPSYADMETRLKAREGSEASKSLAERVQAQWNFNNDSLKSK